MKASGTSEQRPKLSGRPAFFALREVIRAELEQGVNAGPNPCIDAGTLKDAAFLRDACGRSLPSILKH